MTNGSIVGKLIRFSGPLIFSGILQLLFNAADIVVVGRFAGDNSLAAVGSTSSLINLLVNLFVGLSGLYIFPTPLPRNPLIFSSTHKKNEGTNNFTKLSFNKFIILMCAAGFSKSASDTEAESFGTAVLYKQ